MGIELGCGALRAGANKLNSCNNPDFPSSGGVGGLLSPDSLWSLWPLMASRPPGGAVHIVVLSL